MWLCLLGNNGRFGELSGSPNNQGHERAQPQLRLRPLPVAEWIRRWLSCSRGRVRLSEWIPLAKCRDVTGRHTSYSQWDSPLEADLLSPAHYVTSRQTHLRPEFKYEFMRRVLRQTLGLSMEGGVPLVLPSDEICEFCDNSFIPPQSVLYLAIIGLETHEYCPRLRLGTIYIMCPRPIIPNRGHFFGV